MSLLYSSWMIHDHFLFGKIPKHIREGPWTKRLVSFLKTSEKIPEHFFEDCERFLNISGKIPIGTVLERSLNTAVNFPDYTWKGFWAFLRGSLRAPEHFLLEPWILLEPWEVVGRSLHTSGKILEHFWDGSRTLRLKPCTLLKSLLKTFEKIPERTLWRSFQTLVDSFSRF